MTAMNYLGIQLATETQCGSQTLIILNTPSDLTRSWIEIHRKSKS